MSQNDSKEDTKYYRDSDQLTDIRSSGIHVETTILSSARLPFAVSLACILAIVMLFLVKNTRVFGELEELSRLPITTSDSAIVRIIFSNILYIFLFIVALFSSYIGYRLVSAAGATRNPVIPAEDYNLLAPLVAEGKAEAIDQYVRLSSLSKFTGTFTQLGLTGLPLATIFLTLFFSVLTLIDSSQFLDLTKLTLGAFIGSFVQRQIERRGENAAAKETIAEEVAPKGR